MSIGLHELENSLTLVSDYAINKPNSRLVIDILVAVDLLLLVRPIRELLGVRPHGDFGGNVNETEVTRLALPCLAFHTLSQPDLEQGIVVAREIIFGPCRELLISRHQGRCDVMGHQVGLRVDVKKLDNVLMAHDAAATSLGESLGWDNLPVVVGVIVTVASDLLTYDSFSSMLDLSCSPHK